MIKKEIRQIDGLQYTCTQMPATESHRVLIDLDKDLGRTVLVAIAGSDMIGAVASGILFDNVSPEAANNLCRTMMAGVVTKKAGDLKEQSVFDAHFRGRLGHMYKVVEWAIQVNYRDFFYNRKEFKRSGSKPPGYTHKLRKSPNCDPAIWHLVTTNEGLNLQNLVLLQTQLSIVDLYDALESRDVAYSNAEIVRKHLERGH